MTINSFCKLISPTHSLKIEKPSHEPKPPTNQLGPGAYQLKPWPPWTPEEVKVGKFDPKPDKVVMQEVIKSPSRFNPSVRSKEHMKATKADGPGPGDYKLQSAIRVHTRNNSSTFTTFGGRDKRGWSEAPKDVPSPNAYNPDFKLDFAPKRNEWRRHGHSFSMAERKEREPDVPREVGPGSYAPQDHMHATYKTATSKLMLGRNFVPEVSVDLNQPGPGQYDLKDSFNIVKRDKPPEKHADIRKKPEDMSKITQDEIALHNK